LALPDVLRLMSCTSPALIVVPPVIFSLTIPRPPVSTLFPYTTLFRSALTLADYAYETRTNYRCSQRTPGKRFARHRNHGRRQNRSEEHTSEPSHVAISYAVFCLKKKTAPSEPKSLTTAAARAITASPS